MSSNYWLKLYHEMLDDPKVMTLRPALRWRFVETLLVAGEYDQDGLLPELNHYAWRVRANVEIVETELAELVDAGLLSRDEGQWIVTKFAERQAADSPKERMRRMRERKRKRKYYVPETGEQRDSYGGVTNRNADKIRSDKDKIRADARARVVPLVSAFCDYLNRPEPDLDHKTAGRHWINPGLTILAIPDDEAEAPDLVRATLVYMDEEGLSYKNLGSLQHVARTVWKKKQQGSGRGREAEILVQYIQPYMHNEVAFADLPAFAQDIIRAIGEDNIKGRPADEVRVRYYNYMKGVANEQR